MELVLTQHDFPYLLSLLVLLSLSVFHLSLAVLYRNSLHALLAAGWLLHIPYIVLEWLVPRKGWPEQYPIALDIVLLLFFLSAALRSTGRSSLWTTFAFWLPGALVSFVTLEFSTRNGSPFLYQALSTCLFAAFVYGFLGFSMQRLRKGGLFALFTSDLASRDDIEVTGSVPPHFQQSRLLVNRNLPMQRNLIGRAKNGLSIVAFAFLVYAALQILYPFKDFMESGVPGLWSSLFYVGLTLKLLTGIGFAVALRANVKLSEVHLRQAKVTEDLGIITTSVQHQLRGPLQKLILLRMNLEKKIGEYGYTKIAHYVKDLSMIHANLHTVSELIRAMRSSAAKAGLRRVVSVNRVLQSAISISRSQHPGVTPHFEFHGQQLGLSVEADEHWLVHVFVNIINNALEASLEKKPSGEPVVKIDISLDSGSHTSKIRITDSGVGIPANALPYVLKPYSSSKNRPDEPEENRGLGLFVVDRILRIFGGSIDFMSKEGEGTTVIVLLPAHEGHQKGGVG